MASTHGEIFKTTSSCTRLVILRRYSLGIVNARADSVLAKRDRVHCQIPELLVGMA